MKIYSFAVTAAFFLFAFGCGVRIGALRCARDAGQRAIIQQNKNIKNQVTVYEKTMHTGVRDIRRVLREKYTIAE